MDLRWLGKLVSSETLPSQTLANGSIDGRHYVGGRAVLVLSALSGCLHAFSCSRMWFSSRSLSPAEPTPWVILPRKLFPGDRDGFVSELVIFDFMVHERSGHSDGTLWSSLFTAVTNS